MAASSPLSPERPTVPGNPVSPDLPAENPETDLRRRFVRLSLEVRVALLCKIGEAVERIDPENAGALPNLTRCLKEINDALEEEPSVPKETIFDRLNDTVPRPVPASSTAPDSVSRRKI